MEIIYGCKYSKVTAPEEEEEEEEGKQEKVNIPMMRAWRSVKRLASRIFMRRKKKLAAAVIIRRVVCWGSLEFQVKKKVGRISEGIGNNKKYDILSYSKNFDDGEWQQEEVEYYSRRSFSCRFVQGSSCSLDLELDCS